MTGEPWMENFVHISAHVKLRGSYGEIETRMFLLMPIFATISVSNPTASGAYWLNQQQFRSYISSAPALVDPSLTWEQSRHLTWVSMQGSLTISSDLFSTGTTGELLISLLLVNSTFNSGGQARKEELRASLPQRIRTCA